MVYSLNHDDDDSCTITGIGVCKDTEIIIPSVINGHKVTAIGEKAFDHCKNITNVVIPATVKSIGFRAFQYCTSLTEFTIPETITQMGEQIFMECTSLTTVYYNSALSPETGKTVLNTPYIKKIVFGENLTLVPHNICYECENIEEIVLHDGITNIGYYSFYGCTGLKTIDFPEGLQTIDFMAFCKSGLTEIVLPSSITSVIHAFRECYYLKYVIIPVSLTSILGDSFYVCGSFNTFYRGTEVEWQYVHIDTNSASVSKNLYFYSEEIHSGVTNEWHFDENGNPVINQ